jgi:hypothetical protein
MFTNADLTLLVQMRSFQPDIVSAIDRGAGVTVDGHNVESSFVSFLANQNSDLYGHRV